jgi:hypothetical protein
MTFASDDRRGTCQHYDTASNGMGTRMSRAISAISRGGLTSFWTLFLVLVCLHQVYFGWLLIKSSFVPYIMDGNETFSVWWHAHNLYTFSFWKSFGLTDESYGLTEASHPFFHTHQGNVPRFFGFLIYALGARTVEAQVLVTTLVIGNLTLFFCYASVARILRPSLAFIFCLFLFSDYVLYAQWHVVTYRVWYGFLFFGILFAISNAARPNIVWPFTLLGALFFLLFYGELVFACYASIAAFLFGLWLHWGSPKKILKLYCVQVIGGFAAVGLLLLQLAAVFDIDVIKQDFLTTFLARNVAATGVTLEAVGTFFHDHNIVFWNNFRDGDLLRTATVFVRSLSFYIFQVWTPAFFILVAIPLLGVLISFLERAPAGEPQPAMPSDSKGGNAITGLQGRGWSQQLRPTIAHWACYVIVALLALKAILMPGALTGLAPDHPVSTVLPALLAAAAVASPVLVVLGYRTGSVSWAATGRGVLTIALGSGLIIYDHYLFNQVYADIWRSMFDGWKACFALNAGAAVMLATAAAIAAQGAETCFGPARKATLIRAMSFVGVGFVSYTCIYILSPGYVLSGYAERYAPFAIFFAAMVPSLAIYAMVIAGQRYGRWAADRSFSPRVGELVVPVVVALLVGVPVVLWTVVQSTYMRLFPPDHLAFLQKLKLPPFHGATFAVSGYAAPVAYYAGNWAYFDPLIGNAEAQPDSSGSVRLTDPSLRWFADWKTNPEYAHPDFYVCMRTKTFLSVLLERNSARSEAPFPFCKDDRLLAPGLTLGGELMASDFAAPKYWAVVALDAPKIGSVSTQVGLRDQQWRISYDASVEDNAVHPRTASEFELLMLPEAMSCDIAESQMRVGDASDNGRGFELPSSFSGVLQVRARAISKLGAGSWKSGGRWLMKAGISGSAAEARRCPITLAEGTFGIGGIFIGQKGWGNPEPWGTWTVGAHATFQPFPLPRETQGSDFLLDAKIRTFLAKPGDMQDITVRANGVSVAHWMLTDSFVEHDVSAHIPKAALGGRSVLALSFDIAKPVSPASVGLSPDAREVGMGLSWLRLKEESE